MLFWRVCVVEEFVHQIVEAGAVKTLVSHLCKAAQRRNEPLIYRHEVARDCALALALIASKVSLSVRCFLIVCTFAN